MVQTFDPEVPVVETLYSAKVPDPIKSWLKGTNRLEGMVSNYDVRNGIYYLLRLGYVRISIRLSSHDQSRGLAFLAVEVAMDAVELLSLETNNLAPLVPRSARHGGCRNGDRRR